MTEDPGQERVDRARGLTRGRVYSRSSQLSQQSPSWQAEPSGFICCPRSLWPITSTTKTPPSANSVQTGRPHPGTPCCNQCNLTISAVFMALLIGGFGLALAFSAGPVGPWVIVALIATWFGMTGASTATLMGLDRTLHNSCFTKLGFPDHLPGGSTAFVSARSIAAFRALIAASLSARSSPVCRSP